MYKCQYCESTKIKGRVPLDDSNGKHTLIYGKEGGSIFKTGLEIFCDICVDCGYILRLYVDRPSPDFKIDGIDYNT